MSPNSHTKTGGKAKQSNATSSNGSTNEKRNRRRRLQLSCGECREKKVTMLSLTFGDRAMFIDETSKCSYRATGICLARGV